MLVPDPCEHLGMLGKECLMLGVGAGEGCLVVVLVLDDPRVASDEGP